jgi:DNA-binding HxlR family transcriptional regulator
MRLTKTQSRVLHDIDEWCPSPGYATSWAPQTCAALAEKGLIEKREATYWDNKVGWFVTDAGYAAMSATP